jgi:DNA N-6-adenine-methyltransferase Dam
MAEHELSVGQSSEWRTPSSIFHALGIEFDLDPCWPLSGPCFVPARARYTVLDDGLKQSWKGLVYVNPPFGGRRGQVPWLRKFFEHRNGIALVAARTSADWFHELVVPNAELLCFPNGKTKFIRPDGSIGKEPGTGIVLIGAGEIACSALLRSSLGACMATIVPYDGNLDFERSIDACYAAVRARVVGGGKPWVPP